MSTFYTFSISADLAVRDLAELCVGGPLDKFDVEESENFLGLDLWEPCGFGLFVTARRPRWFGALADGVPWEWQPGTTVDAAFYMRDKIAEVGIPNMMPMVARVLAGRPEDAALTLNGDLLLLARQHGQLRKYSRATWWDFYGFVNDIIPG